MHKHHSALGLASSLRPVDPVTLIRPHAAHRAARFFIEKFAGTTMYAVKANPSPALICRLWESGITHYDVASANEVRLVRGLLPHATLCFMNPVKPEEVIREAYHVHGVRAFSLDNQEELDKILRATDYAKDLTLCVRLRVSSDHSKLSLSSKFGIDPNASASLLMAARQASDALGICFHVGSQAMSPVAYIQALGLVRDAIVQAGVTVDVIDVGGGFPSVYPDLEPQALENYFHAIHEAYEALPISYSAELWAEPGRALSAEYSSIMVRVERRRGNELYINDGAYGALFDAAHLNWRFPVRLLRDKPSDARLLDFSFYGPTCDDMDYMAGPFSLPADVAVGDYIEIGMLGAYGNAMRTDFNGFKMGPTLIADDQPMASLYDDENDLRRTIAIR
ncbi:MAG: type III PLP-dependent enzyme [Zymomonas mobilis subsp. pomaceae]|uniref:ornithine decarboxylase n=1 Tax=Zymomonas mobilis subsp. pomaceae (strain ATCC 29192 / DSM 22645 / JCM 10191 / CCUG 17912 / NBRC 13757 / NCIMB 11200 / NRRL B-4491 / Barker I) TaxID=579138 RepID=F8EUE5_ZYMMT|nr:type III PLP-dependent enzyme [Zymomonas mobilis]AEI37161.1 Orn/DAP/Arg decarboxylase 2 [Zymomonas mobilis subsp. pomaceae ATCC 29192]MDX5948531.1 type III PLP-dependent enzyme [Zymomonas mobilis subsp. pomaceae]GEB89839.1 ornithine decarboxylase [Zymomonas mobilis subsp. pomaceae]